MEESNAAELAKTVGAETANQMQQFFHVNEIVNYVKEPEHIVKFATGVIAILIFWIVYRIIRMIIKKGASRKFEPATVKTLSKTISYVFYVLIVMYVLGLFGINLTAIWGAAGIAGVAIGFAAQTTVSNLISGFFILTEKTMKIGDFIEVDGVSGTVYKVGLLSIMVNTPNNQLIRIPSSAIINTKLMNYSSYDYRRYIFEVSVDYSTDLDKAVEVLKSVPARCSLVVNDNPNYASKVLVTGCEDSGIGMNLIVWCERPNFFDMKTEVCIQTVKAFNENGINIPYNRVDVSMLTDKTIPSLSFKA
ncbi:MAG: mechanosensitive ion channel [Treponema sp.]|uniref:mechanosensitive ion channel family protein n=1 Tax=Treponema sp. TaxID=166 RepID=UPI0025F44829|nr:mechanosensitive ion channel family protein [Treponema sp.]MBQ9282791.1 mechanosensitive ion channel [Treponema sp.]